MFYDYNEVKKCFIGKYDKNKSKEENCKKFLFAVQSFNTDKYKKNLIHTVEAMETFIDDGGNRNKAKRKRSKTPKKMFCVCRSFSFLLFSF